MKPRTTPNHPGNTPENISLDDIYSPQAFRERYKHFFTSTNELDYILGNRRLNGLDSYGAVIESRWNSSNCRREGARKDICASSVDGKCRWFVSQLSTQVANSAQHTFRSRRHASSDDDSSRNERKRAYSSDIRSNKCRI